MPRMIIEFVLFLALLVIVAAIFGGCAAKPQVIVEYKYIDRNCTAASDVIAKPTRLKIDWIAIDVNTTRFYCATQGASLLTNIRSCQ